MTARDEQAGTPKVGRLLSRLTENWSLKIVSIVLAVALYAVLHSGGDHLRTVDVDVNLVPPRDPNKILLTQLPSRVRLTVRGPHALIDDLSNVDSIDIDLSTEPQTLRFDTITYKLPPGVRKVGVSPPFIPLRWDSKVGKRVKVESATSAPPEGIALKNLVLEPDSVTITGPKSRVDTVQRLHTVALDLRDRVVGTHTQKLVIDVAADTDPSVVHTDVESVEARFVLVHETRTRSFPNLPVLVMKGKGVTLRPNGVSVVVTCPPKRADELTADAIVPKIDLEALGADFAKKGPEDADVKVEVQGCSEVSVSPPRVSVTR